MYTTPFAVRVSAQQNYQETLGVPVVAYNKTKDFPAFFSPTSGYRVPWNAADPIAAAKILRTLYSLGQWSELTLQDRHPMAIGHEKWCHDRCSYP